jgi:hypothetical protein
MSEHRIRLRKAWEIVAQATAGPAQAARLDLPIAAGQASGPIRLIRRFRRPETGSASERLFVVLEHVPGLTSVTLNSHTIWTGRADANTRLDLDWPPGDDRRGLLTIEAVIDPAREHDWGHVAILIRDSRDGLDAILNE